VPADVPRIVKKIKPSETDVVPEKAGRALSKI
jgi:hypothetical protein